MIIGLCGFPGAGKTEVRKILVREYGFEDINSKSVIYKVAEEATGVPSHKFSDPLYKDGDFEGVPLRQIAAFLGYAIEDLFGDDYLIKQALKNHRVDERPDKHFVIDSLRMNQPILFQSKIKVLEIIATTTAATIDSLPAYDKYQLPENYFTVYNVSSLKRLEENLADILKQMGIHNGK